MLSDPLISWTVRLALLLYSASLLGWVLVRVVPGRIDRAWVRWCWIAGSWVFLGHVVAAFALAHHWSHEHAYVDTARQTKNLLGFEFGAGIYFSYLFALVWWADATWWWLWPASYSRRPAAVQVIVQAYLFFIAANGVIVFKSGVIRWTGLAICASLAVALALRYCSSPWPRRTIENA